MAAQEKKLLLLSPGKLNLYLEIRGVRQDGFHELCLLNTATDLADEVEITLGGTDIEINTDHPRVPRGGDNLCHLAARVFFEQVPRHEQGVSVYVKKRIPVAGGLGGGSSNAACVLHGLNVLTGSNLSRSELCSLGAGVGSDVPFFLFQSPALVSGRGEILEPAPSLPSWFYVIVCFDFGISSSRAYSYWDLTKNGKGDILNPPCQERVPYRPEKFTNDLEPAVSSRHPLIREVREELYGLGCKVSLMSGSGPTVFGIFDSEDAAREAAGHLLGRSNMEAVVCRPLVGAIIKQLV